MRVIYILFFIFILCFSVQARAGTPIPFSITLSETVTVTGTPRLQLDIGGVTRYAPYVSGTGTNTLSFAYPVVAPDFDSDGISIISPIDLNGGTITDNTGNPATLTFTPPDTSGVKVQSYTAAWVTNPVTPANASAVDFDINGAPTGATFNYTISSDGGGSNVTGFGTISANPHHVTGVNLSSLLSGTLTLSVTVTNATGTGNAKTASVTGNIFTGILDNLPATAAAYSVRRLKTSYTGALMRVRRSNDNTEQDIGYVGNGDLDTSALTTFCGSNSCYVKIWYDQSGNARDASQTTAANQPRIVNAGSVEMINSKPSIKWISLNYLSTAYLFSLNQVSIFYTFKLDSLGDGNDQLYDIRANESGNPLFDCGGTSGYAFRRRDNGGILISTSVHSNKNTSPHVSSNTYDGSILSTYLDGTDQKTAASTGVISGTFRIVIGTNGNTPGSGAYKGNISEFYYFPSALSNTDRQTLENNQMAYYNIP